VIGTSINMVQQHTEWFWQKHKKLVELMQPGWEEVTNYFCEPDMKYKTAGLRLLAVDQPRTDDDATVPAPTAIGVLLECIDSVLGISQMPQWNYQARS
jgi:hypothetical protein